MIRDSRSALFFLILVFLLSVFFTWHSAQAQAALPVFAPTGANPTGGDVSSDSIDCMPKAIDTGCGPCSKLKKDSKGRCTIPDPTNKWMCQCKSKVAPTGGVCIATNNCQGKSFVDQQGKTQTSMGDLKGFVDMMKGVMDKLMQKGGGGGEGGQQQQPQQGQQGCTSYSTVSDQALVNNTGPNCTYYVPPVSNSLYDPNNPLGTSNNAVSDLLGALGGGTGAEDVLDEALGEGEGEGETENVSDKILGSLGTGETDVAKGAEGTGTASGELAEKKVALGGGTTGDIRTSGSGVTAFATARDPKANTEVAGFYGSNTFGGQPEGMIARLCRTRPWASSVVSYVIPSSFFDGLCSLRGYKADSVVATTPPVVQSSSSGSAKVQPPPPADQKKNVSDVKPEVDIWAVPARVPLGSRTSVFWNTKGVESCEITSADGNFNEKSPSGGAATVPLSGATDFTITCEAADGQTVETSVTVGLTI